MKYKYFMVFDYLSCIIILSIWLKYNKVIEPVSNSKYKIFSFPFDVLKKAEQYFMKAWCSVYEILNQTVQVRRLAFLCPLLMALGKLFLKS